MLKKPSPRAIRKALDDMQVPETYREPVQPKRPVGRPPTYSRAVYEYTLDTIADGVFLREIERMPGMPSARQMRQKARSDPEFAPLFARAREEQGHAHAERAVMAMREATPENWQIQKALADNERWIASKLAPRTYGDKLDVNHGGVVGTVALPYDPDALTPEQREVMRDVLLLGPKTIEGKSE